MGTEQYEQELLEEIRNLSEEQVREVLDFAVFLLQKVQREKDQLRVAREQAAERMEARRKRLGPIGVQAADLVEEGRTARVTEILREGERS